MVDAIADVLLRAVASSISVMPVLAVGVVLTERGRRFEVMMCVLLGVSLVGRDWAGVGSSRWLVDERIVR